MTEVLPAVPDLAAIEAREQAEADAVVAAVDNAVTMLRAVDMETSETDLTGLSFRGLGVARAIYPLLEDLGRLVKTVRERADQAIGRYLEHTRFTGAVLGGVPYTYTATPGTYHYEAEKMRGVLERFVGTVLTEEELAAVAPVTVIPEQFISAHMEYAIDGAALARILKKRGGQELHIGDGELMTFQQIIDQFRTRDPGVPKLRREEAKK